eukprot:TRINITY_DN20641_c0_g1_i1.p1 TRINITY_DN20641_c0_g1~~TRINITY_DN20641_c0_g1_i1.p1  ORF type:complete len:143 (+),score=49.35 TRINITY_DN20641_c0_g1_i1:28-429(+)
MALPGELGAAAQGGFEAEAAADGNNDAAIAELQAAIAAGDAPRAAALAGSLARRKAQVAAEVDEDVVAAAFRRQMQGALIGMGYAPARVVQALRRGSCQSVDEAVAWLAAQPPAGSGAASGAPALAPLARPAT